MGNPWTLIATLLGLAALYVLLPVGLDTFRRFRKKRVVSCPETGRDAEVGVDAFGAALGSTVGRRRPPSIRECSLWPEREDCGQGCRPALAEEDLAISAPVRRG